MSISSAPPSLAERLVAAVASEPALWFGMVAIVIAFIYAELSTKAARRRARLQTERAALKTMTETIVMLWLLGGICLVCWLASGRDVISLGLNLPALTGESAWRGWAGWAIACVFVLFLLSQLLPLRTSEGRAEMAKALEGMEGVDLIQPQTGAEHRRFQLMAVSAGWNEEIIFRGFLLGALVLVMPLWAAALVSMVIFIGFHTYQGVSGMIRIIPITLGLTVLVVLSGSLWPAIIVHIAADMVGGLYLYLSRKPVPTLAPAAP